MSGDFEYELSVVGDDIFLGVGSERWRVLLQGVRRISSYWFEHAVALGPRVCDFTIQISSPPNQVGSARLILRRIAEWLRSGDTRRHVFIEATLAN